MSKHPLADRVRAMRLDAMSFTDIAKELGVTKGSVAGLCRRLGLCEPKPAKVKVGVTMQEVPAPEPEVEIEIEEEIAEIPEEVIAAPQEGVSMIDLKDYSCRWIDGERYCGKRKVTGAYCAPHAALAYVPSKPRKISGRDVDFRHKLTVNV